MIAEIARRMLKDRNTASKRILEDKETLLRLMQLILLSLSVEVELRSLGRKSEGTSSYCLRRSIPKEAMGANMLNTMLEALTDRIQELSGGQP